MPTALAIGLMVGDVMDDPGIGAFDVIARHMGDAREAQPSRVPTVPA